MTGRVAGGLYLVIIACGLFAELAVRSRLFDFEDPVATLSHINASPTLFRAGLVADVVMLWSDVGLAVLLYVLLEPVGRTLALAAAAFRLMQAAIIGASLLSYQVPMLLWASPDYSRALTPDQLAAFVMLSLDAHRHGYDLALVFFAVSNVALGALLVRSRRCPTAIGYGLQAAAVVYGLGSGTRFLAPAYLSYVEPWYIVPLVAELAFAVWLLARRGETPLGMPMRSA